MNSIRFETFAPIRRRKSNDQPLNMREKIAQRLEERKVQRMEKNRRCARVFA